MDWSKSKSRKYKSFLLVLMILFLFYVTACSKPIEAPEQSDWREQYGNTQNSTVTPDVGELSATVAPKKENPSETTSERVYPTQAPVPEFVPKDDQKELVLFLQGSSGTLYDEHVETALNLLLQERGYSFYVTIRTEENYGFPLSKWLEMLDAGEKIDLIYFEGAIRTESHEELEKFAKLCKYVNIVNTNPPPRKIFI